jgi:hypothetical protein
MPLSRKRRLSLVRRRSRARRQRRREAAALALRKPYTGPDSWMPRDAARTLALFNAGRL